MITTYWWRGGGGSGNFGDKLGPAIIEHLSGQSVSNVSIDRAEVLAIGSVLEPWFWPKDAWQHFQGYVWGVGRMFGKVPMALPQARLLAVRGRLSAQRLGLPPTATVAIGDPGILCPLLQPAAATKRFKVGIWPHWSEKLHPKIRALLDHSPDVKLIDPCGDIRQTLQLASSCEIIAASSLHGLITADAYGIPRCWLRLNTGKEDEIGMPVFKYADYFSAYSSAPPDALFLTGNDSLDSIVSSATCAPLTEVEAIQLQLMNCFPFP